MHPHTDHPPTRALVTHQASERARRREAQLRAHCISFVMEHMDVLAVTVAMGRKVDNETLRHQAEVIVDGVYAIRTEAH
jgi:hypothetical protein